MKARAQIVFQRRPDCREASAPKATRLAAAPSLRTCSAALTTRSSGASWSDHPNRPVMYITAAVAHTPKLTRIMHKLSVMRSPELVSFVVIGDDIAPSQRFG